MAASPAPPRGCSAPRHTGCPATSRKRPTCGYGYRCTAARRASTWRRRSPSASTPPPAPSGNERARPVPIPAGSPRLGTLPDCGAMRRRQGILVLGLCAVLGLGLGAVGVAAKIRRDAEWAHGGDRLTASAQVRTSDEAGLPATVTALGGPSIESAFLPLGTHALVVRLQWTRPDEPRWARTVDTV